MRPTRLRPSRDAVPAGAERSLPLLAIVFMVSLLIPNFAFVGPVRLAPFLLIIVITFVPLFFYWAMGQAGRVRLPDVLVLAAALWEATALFVNHGSGEALEPAGIVVLQTFGAYLIGRCCIRGPQAMRRVVKTWMIMVAVLLPFALYETVTGVPLWIVIFSTLGPTYGNAIMEPRMGFDRVQGAFEHPILYGIFVASLFATARTMLQGPLARTMASGMIALATMVSLSTGALVCFVIQVMALVWGWLMRLNRSRWKILIGVVIAGYITIDLLSNRSPFEVFVSYMTFNLGSAYNRILIWTFGTAEVLENPIFGIGMHDWDRPHWMHSGSFDMFWLLIAMRYGIAASVMLGLACFLLMFRAAARQGLDPLSARLRTGHIISMVAIFTAIWSVHLWNATFCWMMFLIGSMGWMTEAGRPAGTHAPAPDPAAAAGAAPAAQVPDRPRTWL